MNWLHAVQNSMDTDQYFVLKFILCGGLEKNIQNKHNALRGENPEFMFETVSFLDQS